MYFFMSPGPDVDNIVKPVLDALRGLVYVDDSQVVDLIASMRSLTGNYRAPMSTILAQAFTTATSDFVYVHVDDSVEIEALR